MSTLRFPTNRPPTADYVVFTHKKYVPNNKQRQDATKKRGFAKFEPNNKSSYDAPVSDNTISLYMPTTVPGMKTDQSWNSTGNTFGSPLRRILTAAVSGFGLSSGGEFGDVFEEAYAYAGSQVTGTSINEYLTLTGGAIFNPNVEMLYDGLSTRGFQFDFFMAANSENDTQVITDIVNEFKQYSSPSARDNWLTVPHMWQVTYKSGVKSDESFFNKFKPSMITSINVQDNSGLNYHSTFRDGSPIVTAISIQFAEVDIITREDHEEAIDEGFVRVY